MEEVILASLVESLALEVALDLHWLVKTGQLDAGSMSGSYPSAPTSSSSAAGSSGTAAGGSAGTGTEFVNHGHLLVNTSDGIFRKMATGELRKVHGNSKLHPKHQSNHAGGDFGDTAQLVGSGGVGGGGRLPPSIKGLTKAQQQQQLSRWRQEQELELQKQQQQQQRPVEVFPHHNSLEHSTVYSSSYYPAAALSGNGSNKASADTRLIARCPVCMHPVAGSRFAAHLERCLSGGGRAKGLLTTSGSGSGTAGLEETVKRGKTVFEDPHPNSCIVRIRVNSTGATLGQPKVFQEREGVSQEEWDREGSARDARRKAT